MKVLLFGPHGQVGFELSRILSTQSCEVISVDQSMADFTRPHEVREAIRRIAPHVIVNAAAYTAVDKAESEPELARAVNATAPAVMAEEAKRIGAYFVHYSTDYVFNGAKRQPYVETDPVSPLNVYGQTKLEGDQAIMASGARHLILRVAWVYATRGKNFLLTVLRLAREGKALRIVNDQFGVPTSARSIADVTARVLAAPHPVEGLYHFSPAGETSWHGFAAEILRGTGFDSVMLQPIPTSEYPTPAKRPAYSVLSANKLKQDLSFQPPHWQQMLHEALAGFNSVQPGALSNR